MTAEEFTRDSNQSDRAIQQGYSQTRPNSVGIFIGIVFNQFREKGDAVGRTDQWIRKVSPGREFEPLFANLE
jgi:hypothetical protein